MQIGPTRQNNLPLAVTDQRNRKHCTSERRPRVAFKLGLGFARILRLDEEFGGSTPCFGFSVEVRSRSSKHKQESTSGGFHLQSLNACLTGAELSVSEAVATGACLLHTPISLVWALALLQGFGFDPLRYMYMASGATFFIGSRLTGPNPCTRENANL